MYDRGWPAIETTMGAAEFVFGSSLGVLRSEQNVDNTTFVFGPQLIDNCDDSTTITGNGYVTTISTQCVCASSSSNTSLSAAGVDSSIMAQFQSQVAALGSIPGMALSFAQVSNTSITITHALTGTAVCGGGNSLITDPPLPVCYTILSDHRGAVATMQYMTDGTPASIAPKVFLA